MLPKEGVWKNVYEANLGYKLLENHELWIDAGVLPSHIGGESGYCVGQY
ncbi:outer membrane beta-barrel protein [Sphingobacterium daejeonense]